MGVSSSGARGSSSDDIALAIENRPELVVAARREGDHRPLRARTSCMLPSIFSKT